MQAPASASDRPAELGVQDLVAIAVKGPALTAVARDIAPLLGPHDAWAYVKDVLERLPSQGLVMNPMWVELAGEGRETETTTMLDSDRVPLLAIPDKLWGVIRAMKGRFSLVEARQPTA